jgi:phosphoglycolate phosphatase
MQKPDPEILRRTIQAAGGALQRAVMVGDSGIDIATARAAGVPIVAVDFGYSETPIRNLRPDRLISHFNELADAVSALAQPE